MSISRPDYGAFQVSKYKEKLALQPKFTNTKASIITISSPFLLFNEIIKINFQNVLIFAEKFDIIKPTGENNDFNV